MAGGSKWLNRLLLWLVMVLTVAMPGVADLGPENVVVVVNEDSWASLCIANEYIRLRKIPPSHVIYLDNLPHFEKISVTQFRQHILQAIWKTLEERELTKQIDCIAYSSDLPWAIDLQSDIGKRKLGKFMTPVGSLNGLTFLHHQVRNQNLSYLSLNSNWYARQLAHYQQQGRYEVQPPQGFKSYYFWNYYSQPTSETGRQYILATMLGITSGRGNSPEEVKQILRRSTLADASAPSGTIYYLKNSGIRSKTREWGLASAVEKIASLGVRAQILPGNLPQDKQDVAGAMTGVSRFDWQSSNSTILPGAICEHLTSFGGILHEGATQTPLSQWIAHGASGSSGTVTEPYALQNKFPNPFLHYFYVSGCTLAESFYQAVKAPYQLLVVGDPLCSPWRKPGQLEITGTPDGLYRGKVSLQARLIYPLLAKIRYLELYLNGKRQAVFRPNAKVLFDTRNFRDGFHQLTIVAVLDARAEHRIFWRREIEIANHSSSLKKLPFSWHKQVRWGEKVTLSHKDPRGKWHFWHNGRFLATLDEQNSSISLDTKKLGWGSIALQVYYENNEKLQSLPPLTWEILPPAAISPLTMTNSPAIEGLRLATAKQSKILSHTKNSRWYQQLPDEQEFTVEGYFFISQPGIYQFQAFFPAQAEFRLNQRPWQTLEKGQWHFLPCHLPKGWFKVTFRSKKAKQGSCWLRFGNKGVYSLSKEFFFTRKSQDF